MSRLLRSAVSFAIVLVAYWIYALAAVPLIEPSIADSGKTNGERSAFEPSVDQRFKQFEGLFAPGVWDPKNTIVLENDKCKLLMKSYKNLGDGRVELQPCTMVFPWDGPAEDEIQRRRQAIVLEAPQGAILKFDKPIDLRALKIGRLVGGKLSGPITIRSQGKQPGPEDDLLIRTQDVEMNEQEVWTPQPVEFTWGKNSGRGQDMHIKLLADPARGGGDVNAPNVGGVEVFELRRMERLHLETTPAATAQTAADLPVEITCNAAFSFNVVKRVASFNDQVVVVRVNPNGPSDQIQCDLLLIFFLACDASQGASKNATDLEPERIEARGRPVVINAPTQNLTGRGERLEYNLKTQLIALDGGPEVFLRQGDNEIHGRSLQYQSLGPKRLGRAAAQGPGWLSAQMADNPQGRLKARWNDQLRLFPQGENQVISFSGGAILEYAGIGCLEAQEIFFWLKETPSVSGANQAPVRPDRMMARKQVALNSARLSAAVEQLEVWFEQKDAPQDMRWKADGTSARQSGAGIPGGPLSAAPNAPYGHSAAGMVSPAAAGNALGQKQHFKIGGRMLRARLLLADNQSNLVELMIEDSVRLEETQTRDPNERPVLLQGDRLHAQDVSLPTAVVNVTGRPAHFEGRGLGLTGTNINLDRGANRLWIDGPGRMDLPQAGNPAGQLPLAGQPASAPGTLLVEWKKQMVFDGRTAKFLEAASATTPQQHMQTDHLEVWLKNPLNFSDLQLPDQTQPEVEELHCYGGVLLENRSADAQGQLLSLEHMQITADLAVNLQTGAISAGGPGWLNRVGLAADEAGKKPLGAGMLGQRPAAPAANNGTANPPEALPQLSCLHVCFQGSITGNLLKRELVFHKQIRACYAPVAEWTAMLNPDKPEMLGPNGIRLQCNHLQVNQMPTPTGNERAIEVAAWENAVVEGGIFTARAYRVGYAEAKGQLILEGDGRSDAQLFRQNQPGAPASKVSARKIIYWPKTNSIKVDGARSLEINQLPAGGN